VQKTIVAFGEIMLRLTPPENGFIREADSFSACYGGSESNVLVCLSALGNATRFLTAVPQGELGQAVCRHLRAYGVGTGEILQTGDTLGMYFLEEGFGKRPAQVIYNRRHSAVTTLSEDAFDYDRVFADCGLFHICGISFALSASCRALAFRLMQEARKRNIPVSFDFNYRAKLWTVEEAAAVYREIMKYVDIVFCSARDLSAFLDTNVHRFFDVYSPSHLVVREREVREGGRQAVLASFYRKKAGCIEEVRVDKTEFPVLERIGAGDAFVGGVLHVLCRDFEDIQGALAFGVACFVLKHTVRGDVFALSEDAVQAYLSDVAKDVSR